MLFSILLRFCFFFCLCFSCASLLLLFRLLQLWLALCLLRLENNVTVLACSEAGKQRPAIITTIIRNKKNAPQTSATYASTPHCPPLSATTCSSHVHLIVLRSKHFAVRQRPSCLSALSDICTLWKSAFVFHANCSRSTMFTLTYLPTTYLPPSLSEWAWHKKLKNVYCFAAQGSCVHPCPFH